MQRHRRVGVHRVSVSDADGHRVVQICGELDIATRNLVRQACLGRSSTTPSWWRWPSMTFMDCCGYGGLVAARRHLQEQRRLAHAAQPSRASPLELLDDAGSARSRSADRRRHSQRHMSMALRVVSIELGELLERRVADRAVDRHERSSTSAVPLPARASRAHAAIGERTTPAEVLGPHRPAAGWRCR